MPILPLFVTAFNDADKENEVHSSTVFVLCLVICSYSVKNVLL